MVSVRMNRCLAPGYIFLGEAGVSDIGVYDVDM